MASNADRIRATKVRKAAKAGRASAEQIHWLKRYEASRDAAARTPKPRRASTGSASPTPAEGASAAPKAPAEAPEPRAAPSAPPPGPGLGTGPGHGSGVFVPDGEVAIPFAAVPESTAIVPVKGHGTSVPGKACDIPDCPACKQQRGALVCGSTGAKVWPPMHPRAALMAAGGFLWLIGLAVKFFRDDKRLIVPTADERQNMAEAIREVQLRRASWIGAVDDLLMASGALTAYTFRAAREPSIMPARAPQGAVGASAVAPVPEGAE